MKLTGPRWQNSEPLAYDAEVISSGPKVSAEGREEDVITWDPKNAIAKFNTDDAILFCQALIFASDRQLENLFPKPDATSDEDE